MKNLILFPYAGSLGLAYTKWRKMLSEEFNVHTIYYTNNNSNQEIKNYEELVDFVYDQVIKIIGDGETIFFGHSMGVRVILSVYDRLVENNEKLPCQLILSGSGNLKKIVISPYERNEDDFMQEYIDLGGISQEVMESQELYDYVKGELARDIFFLSQFNLDNIKNKPKCPVEVLNGTKDEYTPKEIWDEFIGKSVEYRMFEGDHFFIYSNEENLMRYLKKFA